MKLITTSPDISKLDFSILYDISTATPSITLTNLSVGTGLANCSWWYVIETPNAQYIHKGTQSTPDVTNSNWTTIIVPDAWPQPFGQIEWSGASYKATLYVIDSEDNVFSTGYDGTICRPNGSDAKTIGNFGYGSLTASVKCEQAQLVITDTTNYVYQTLTGSRVSKEIILIFPPDSEGNAPARQVINNMNAAVFTISYNGTYNSYINTVYDYAINDNVTVRVQYKVNQPFKTQCNIDLCPVICEIDKLITNIQATCGNNIDPESTNKLLLINSLLAQAFIGKQQPLCGIDVAAVVDKIMKIGGFSCNCIVPGNGVNGSPLSGINIEVDTTCGDIQATVTQLGNNVLIQLEDKSYLFKICDTAPTAAFTVTASDGPNCEQIYCLNVDLEVLKTDLDIATCCPICVEVKLHDAPDQNPPACPGSYFPATVYDPTNVNPIGIANDINELIGILNANAGWIAKGKASASGNCSVCFNPAAGITVIPNVHVELGNTGPCVGNAKQYIVNVKEYVNETVDVPTSTFPVNMFVRYTVSGIKYPLELIADYAALIAAIGAEANKPSNITYTSLSQTNLSIITVQINDDDCLAGNDVAIFAEVDGTILFGSDDNMTNDGNGAERIIFPRSSSVLGKLCGDPSAEKFPWHTVKVGNILLMVNSGVGGALLRYDISSPLSPVPLAGYGLNSAVPLLAPNVPFSGLPLYSSGKPSNWDVYFVTDVNAQTDGSIIYIVESVSGCIWKYDYLANSVVSYFYSDNLVGLCPRIIYNGKLYFTMDGDRAADTGLGSVNPLVKGDTMILDLNTFTSTSFSQGTVYGAGTKEIWAMSVDPANPDIAWITSSEGDLTKYSMLTDSVGANFNNKWNVNFGTGAGTLLNTYILNRRIYASSHGYGTFYLDNLDNVGPETPVQFDALPADGGDNLKHFTILPVPAGGYAIVTYDNDNNIGGVAKFSLDGAFYEIIDLNVGSGIFNLVPAGPVGSPTPNTYCP